MLVNVCYQQWGFHSYADDDANDAVYDEVDDVDDNTGEDADDEMFERCDSRRSHSDYTMPFPALQWRSWGWGLQGGCRGVAGGEGLECAMN